MENTLKVILGAVEPLPVDREIRLQILQELQAAVESVESLRGATVEPFGSFVSELFTRWGDLDVSIEFSKGSYISAYGKKHTKNVLRDVLKAMRMRGGWNFCQFIPHARVPILMVKSKLNDISCDISVNNLKAQMKSKLLFWISDIDPRFHDMVLLVKEWAKTHNINNSKSGTFNSYSLSLLVVFHFQTCAPAILPPLQDIYPGTLTDDLKGLRDDAERLIETSCIENIRRFKASRLRDQNESSLSQLFISFLSKFSDLSLKAVELGICTYSGKWEALESNMGWLPKTYCILVEDPFDRPENTARGVGSRALNRISEVFEMSWNRLITASYSSSLAIESSLLMTLVRPQTLNHIIRNLGYNIEFNQTTHPQHIMAESSHSRPTRHYQGPPKPNGSYRPYVPESVPPRDYHNRPQKLKGPYVPELVKPKNYSSQQKPTGPYVEELVDSCPQVTPGRKPVHSPCSSPQVTPGRNQVHSHSSSLQITPGRNQLHSPCSSPQVHPGRKPVHSHSSSLQVTPGRNQLHSPWSSPQVHPGRKPVHSHSSSLQVTPGRKPVHSPCSSPQVSPGRKPVHSPCSSPQVSPGRKPVHSHSSSPQVTPGRNQVHSHSSSLQVTPGRNQLHSPCSSPQVHPGRKPVHSHSLVSPQIQKPMHSSSQVKPQIQKPAHSSPQEQPYLGKFVPSTSQLQSPLQEKKKEKAYQLLQKSKRETAPMLQAYQEWRPKEPGMQL